MTAWSCERTVSASQLDYPHIAVRKCSPRLIHAMGIEEMGEGKLRVPVTAIACLSHGVRGGVDAGIRRSGPDEQ